MQKFGRYIVLGIGMYGGGYLGSRLGEGLVNGWSILGAFVGGILAVLVIYKLEN